jgi:hypothetical protein
MLRMLVAKAELFPAKGQACCNKLPGTFPYATSRFASETGQSPEATHEFVIIVYNSPENIGGMQGCIRYLPDGHAQNRASNG